MMPRRAFTLYETLMATAILALGLLGALGLFPKALETQKLARQRILAATVAYDMVTKHASGFDHAARLGNDEYELTKSTHAPDLERLGFRDISSARERGGQDMSGGSGDRHHETGKQYSSDVDDLMSIQASYRGKTLLPLPREIAKRLDSDGDEIRRLNDEHVALYYLMPTVINNDDTGGSDYGLADEVTNTLICAVVGYPQQNATYHSPSDFHTHAMIGDAFQYFWRRKAAFRYYDDGTDASGSPVAGATTGWKKSGGKWRAGYFNTWRYNLYATASTASGGLNLPNTGNGAWVFPTKYYLWDWEPQVVNGYYEWSKYADHDHNFTYENWHRERTWPHGTTGVFDPLEDTDVAFPLHQQETNSLYVPFKPSHRCREIVFWTVNWKDYEDSETVWMWPGDQTMTGQGTNWPYDGMSVADDPVSYYLSPAISNPGYIDTSLYTAFQSSRLWEGGIRAVYERWYKSASDAVYEQSLSYGLSWTPSWHGSDNIHLPFQYVDRDFNEVKSVGRIPRTVRLRAQTVARFNYYDKRLYTTY